MKKRNSDRDEEGDWRQNAAAARGAETAVFTRALRLVPVRGECCCTSHCFYIQTPVMRRIKTEAYAL